MTPAQLRRICNSLNDHRGTGGQTRLAELLGVHPTLIRKKLAGKVPISKKDELAIQQVTDSKNHQPKGTPMI
jgi:DNA-binding transcriptional regulator YdaS (Cro superfamily)